jgi:small-conductance mechanosensitive channel
MIDTKIYTDIHQVVYKVLMSVINDFISFLPKLATALILFFIFWFIASLIKKSLFKLSLTLKNGKERILQIMAQLINGIILLIGIITALGSMGVNISALVASVGLSGFAISFAMKESLSNLLAGMMILFYQPFKKGDTICVDSYEGKVIAIDLRYTSLASTKSEKPNRVFLIPNSVLLTKSIEIEK